MTARLRRGPRWQPVEPKNSRPKEKQDCAGDDRELARFSAAIAARNR
jgi:hypothetical protein